MGPESTTSGVTVLRNVALVTTSTRALTKQQTDRVRTHLKLLTDRSGSQLAASRLVGISQQVYNRIGKGDAVGLYVTKKVARYLQLPLEYFLDGAPPNLERVIVASPRHWSSSTLAAILKFAAELKSGNDLPEDDWRQILDDLENTIAPIVKRARGRLR